MAWYDCVVDNAYEISDEYPYQIRKKSNHHIVSEHDNGNGYIRLKLNGQPYYKHRIVALQFIPNPDDLPEIDHKYKDRTDYHIENLRWISRSKNQENKLSHNGINYEYIDDLPDDSIEVTDYNEHQFEDLYYSESLDRFLFYNGVQYRILHVNHRAGGAAFVNANNINNVRVKISYAKFKRIYGFE